MESAPVGQREADGVRAGRQALGQAGHYLHGPVGHREEAAAAPADGIAVGSSLQVQPAAGLAGLAADHGARLIIVNAAPTPYDERADEVIRESIGTALPKLLRTLGEES